METGAGTSCPRGKSWLQGAGPPFWPLFVGLLGKPGMETVGWGGGQQHRSK